MSRDLISNIVFNEQEVDLISGYNVMMDAIHNRLYYYQGVILMQDNVDKITPLFHELVVLNGRATGYAFRTHRCRYNNCISEANHNRRDLENEVKRLESGNATLDVASIYDMYWAIRSVGLLRRYLQDEELEIPNHDGWDFSERSVYHIRADMKNTQYVLSKYFNVALVKENEDTIKLLSSQLIEHIEICISRLRTMTKDCPEIMKAQEILDDVKGEIEESGKDVDTILRLRNVIKIAKSYDLVETIVYGMRKMLEKWFDFIQTMDV